MNTTIKQIAELDEAVLDQIQGGFTATDDLWVKSEGKGLIIWTGSGAKIKMSDPDGPTK